MVKAIMHGCNGHMGQVITGLIKDDPEIEIVVGIDPVDCRDNGYPVFPNLHACTVECGCDSLISHLPKAATV